MNKVEAVQFIRDEAVNLRNHLNRVVPNELLAEGFNPEYFCHGGLIEDSLCLYVKDLNGYERKVKCVKYFGGEGMGDTRYIVFKLDTPEGDVYLEFHGSYDSWNGTEWYEAYLVEPREVTVIEYHKVQA